MHIKGNNGQVVVTVTMLPCEQRHQEATRRAVLEACRRAHCRCFTNAALFLPSTHPEGRLQAPSFCRREPGAPEALAAPGHSMGSIPRQVEVTQHSTSRGCIPGTAVLLIQYISIHRASTPLPYGAFTKPRTGSSLPERGAEDAGAPEPTPITHSRVGPL